MAAERRSYSKVYRRIWLHRVFRAFPDREKVMALYLLSGPQTNRIGLFAFSLARAAEDLSWSADSTETRLSRVLTGFSWEFDRANRVIYIPSWWEFNAPGKQENHFRGMLSDLNDVPRTPLISKFCSNLDYISHELRPIIAEWEALLKPEMAEASIADASPMHSSTETKTKTETETEGGEEEPAASGKEVHDFIAGFCERYSKYRHGAKYLVRRKTDIPNIRRLLKTFSAERLLRLSVVMFRIEDDEFIVKSDRGIGVLTARASYLDARLAEAEAKQAKTA